VKSSKSNRSGALGPSTAREASSSLRRPLAVDLRIELNLGLARSLKSRNGQGRTGADSASVPSSLLRLPAVGDNAAMQTEPPKADPPKRKRRWFQFSLRSLLIAVTLSAVVCSYVGWQDKIVRARKAVLESRVKHAYAICPMSASFYRGSALRRWLGDLAIEQFCFDDNATDDEIDEVRRAFPEAALWRGEHPPRLIEEGSASDSNT
jgi:hypothetical protein